MAKNKVEITGIDTSTLKTLKTEEMNNLFIEPFKYFCVFLLKSSPVSEIW